MKSKMSVRLDSSPFAATLALLSNWSFENDFTKNAAVIVKKRPICVQLFRHCDTIRKLNRDAQRPGAAWHLNHASAASQLSVPP
jgi:hypothetical protein